MEKFRYILSLFLFEIVTFAIKWGIIFTVSAVYKIATFDLLLMIVLFFLDLIAPTVLKSNLLKAITAFAIWYFLLPLLKNGIIEEPTFLSWVKAISISFLILVAQFFEMATFLNLIEKGLTYEL
jgi:hypothetical protein